MFQRLVTPLKRRQVLTPIAQGFVATLSVLGIDSIAQSQPTRTNPNSGKPSMFRHVIVFKLKPDIAATDRDQWLALGRQLPNRIPVIRAFSIGTDVLHQPRSYDVTIIADFDNLDAYKQYEAHPAHQAFHQGSSRLCQQIVSVDYQT